MEGLPLYRAMSPDGRWAYTLYDGRRARSLHPRPRHRRRAAVCVDLPQLADLPRRFYYLLQLQTSEAGAARRRAACPGRSRRERCSPSIRGASRSDGPSPWPPRRAGSPLAAARRLSGGGAAAGSSGGVARLTPSSAAMRRRDLLAAAVAAGCGVGLIAAGQRFPTRRRYRPGQGGGDCGPAEDRRSSPSPAPPPPGNLLARSGVVGHSAKGRPIGLLQLGDPAIDGKLLVFGCIHGDECAASEIQPLTNGCPDPALERSSSCPT